jgi:hypothetical protein
VGTRGPVPNRSDQRVRRNKPEVPIETVVAIGNVPVPRLNLCDPHPLVVDLYESLRHSAQSKYYEPSDWQYARVCLHFADQLLKSSRPSAQLLVTVNQMLSSLLVSEGDRRRVRMEVERNQDTDGGEVLQVADLFRQRLMQG